ncbi:MAG TPA: ATP-binding protein [Candidatus Cloacimonadota bacterium]|nr:ATP-binding protein [Candidatus Cloacimonadota bacterium]
MGSQRILIVEDEMIISMDIQKLLINCGYTVCGMTRFGEEALEKTAELKPDLVLLDIMLGGKMSGLEVAEIIYKRFHLPFIFISAYADDNTLQKAIITEPYGYIVKPFDERELKVVLELAFYKFQMENKLRESQEKYRLIFENIQDIYCEFDLNLKVIEISPSIETFTGFRRTELIGKSVLKLFAEEPEVKKMIALLKQNNKLQNFELHLKSKSSGMIEGSCQCRLNKDDGKYKKIICSIRDITKQRAMEKRVLQTERLAGVGQLAAGIAHEIRNPLGNISSAIQLCLNKFKPAEPLNQYLQIVLRNSQSANQIIKELLEFANPRDIDLHSTDLTRVMENALGMVFTRCEEHRVTVIRNFPDDLPTMMLDEKWLQQCFLNFILNAIDAIQDDGTIEIAITLEPESVVIRFMDNGCGISQTDLDRIFDPFFTTKSQGTGLGLSMAYQIINAHKGTIDFESKIGEGTTVTVRLPQI